jgi:tetratricopeptide (TPR) repeat protein
VLSNISWPAFGDFLGLLLLIIVSGGFGGYVAAVFENLIASQKDKANGGVGVTTSSEHVHACNKCNSWYFICRGLIGIAGAFGVVLIGGWLTKVKLDLTVDNAISLVGLCVVAGCVSYELLPIIGHKLRKQMDALENAQTGQAIQIENLKKQGIEIETEWMKKMRDIDEQRKKYTDAITLAEIVLENPEHQQSLSDAYSAISKMEMFRESSKFQRVYNIYLGRLYRRVGNWDSAIIVLRDYIDNLDNNQLAANIVEDTKAIDKAAALYNISCYHILKADMDKHTEEEVNKLFEEALNEFKASLKLDPSSWECAEREDEHDFDAVKQHSKWSEVYNTLIQESKEICKKQLTMKLNTQYSSSLG